MKTKNKNNKIILIFILSVSYIINAQVGIGTVTPNNSSILDVFSTDKGMLIPRIDLIETTNFAPLLSHVNGMQVYNTATSLDVFPGLYYNDGTKWIRVADASTSKNYAFLRTSDNLDAATSGDQSVNVYRSGETSFGNVHTNNNIYYGSLPIPSSLGRANVSVIKNFNLASEFPAGSIQMAGQFVSLINTPSGSTHSDTRGLIGRVYTAENANTYNRLYGASISSTHAGTSSVNQAFGTLSTVRNNTTGSINEVFSAQADVTNFSTGTITNSKGLNQITINNGNITTSTGLNIEKKGTGTYNTNYGIRISDSSSGTTTTNYGIYIDDLIGTNQWGIYQLGSSDKNYFSGHSAIGNFQNNADAGYSSGSGTVLASAALNVYENFNTAVGYTTQENIGIASSIILNMPAGSTHVYSKAIVGSVVIPATNTQNYSVINGANFRAYNLGSGNVGQIIGNILTARNLGSGNVTDIIGNRIQPAHLGTGTNANLTGDLITLSNSVGSGTVTNAYGVNVNTAGWLGSNATNYYGLYLDQGKGVNNYAIYTNNGYIRVGNIPVYNTEALATAGGLPSGVLYRTNTGEIRIKL